MDNASVKLEHYHLATKLTFPRKTKFKFLKMEKNLTFVKPKNEATAKFYTEVLKNRLGIEPNPFLPKKSAQTHITRCF